MGAIAWTLVTGLVAGLSAAAPWMVYANRVVRSLDRQSARPLAYPVAALPAVVASVLQFAHAIGFTTGSVRDDVILIAATVGLACSWGPIARGATSVTGGPSVLRDTAPTDDLRLRSTPLSQVARRVGFSLGVGLFIVTMTTFTVPAVASIRACLDTERILATAESPHANPAPIDIALSQNPPEPGAQYLVDALMSLDLTVDGKSDPQTRDQLVAAGFVDAYFRSWLARDGGMIQIEIIEFATGEGAGSYQGQVNRYACGSANQAFEAPMGGIGLQVRSEGGARHAEQISWVAGNRRYLVMVSGYERPSGHSRIMLIHEATTRSWPPAPDPVAGGPVASETPAASVSPNSLDEVRAAVDATVAEGSVWMNTILEFVRTAETLDNAAQFNGLVSLEPRGDLQGSVTPLDEAAHAGESSMEVRFDGGLVYLRGQNIDSLVGEGRWLVFDIESTDALAERYRPLVFGHNGTTMAMLYLNGITQVRGVSDDEIHEQPAHRYEVLVDLEAAVDNLPPEFAAPLRTHVAALQSAGIDTDLTAEIWVGRDGLVHHIDVVQGLAAEIGGGELHTSIDLFDWGVPMDLDIPEPELVTPVEDVRGPTRPMPGRDAADSADPGSPLRTGVDLQRLQIHAQLAVEDVHRLAVDLVLGERRRDEAVPPVDPLDAQLLVREPVHRGLHGLVLLAEPRPQACDRDRLRRRKVAVPPVEGERLE
jgi:hypothetical protein